MVRGCSAYSKETSAPRIPLTQIAPYDASHRRGNPTSPRKRGEVKSVRALRRQPSPACAMSGRPPPPLPPSASEPLRTSSNALKRDVHQRAHATHKRFGTRMATYWKAYCLALTGWPSAAPPPRMILTIFDSARVASCLRSHAFSVCAIPIGAIGARNS
jgi:hypothetical protein